MIYAYNCDCRKLLSSLASDSVDLVVTDPAYKTKQGGNKSEGRPGGILSANDGKIFKHNSIKFEQWIPDLYRVMKPGSHGYIFVNWYNFIQLNAVLEKSGFLVHDPYIWKKGNKLVLSRFGMKAYEFIFMVCKRPIKTITKVDGMTPSNLLDFDPVKDRTHPTQKPEKALRSLILRSSMENDVVLDPFAGTGSTLKTAASLNRIGIGSEIDPEYFRFIKEETPTCLEK